MARSFRVALAATLVGALSAIPTSSASAAPPRGAVDGPLDTGTYAVTSYFGARCLPIINASTSHGGVDLGAADGSPLYAVADGRVVRAEPNFSAGQWLVVEHVVGGRRVQVSYSHMWDADRFVRVGQTVRRGQKIAEVGSSGVSTSPHLHLEVWLGSYGSGTQVDPLGWFRSQGVDLLGAATRVVPRSGPGSCTYYAVGPTPVRTSASAGAPVVATVPNHTVLTSSPGTKSNGFLPVRAGNVSGWAHASDVSPTRLGVPTARTTGDVVLRSAPSASAAEVAPLGAGTGLEDVMALSAGWYQVETGGRTGWLPAGRVRLEAGTSRTIDYGFFLANTFTTTADTVFEYGDYFDEFFVGDFDGDGVDTFAYRRGQTFYVRDTNLPGGPDRTVAYGRPGDTVLVGDWDGDGVDTFAVRRGSSYHIKNSVTSGPADTVVVYGRSGDTVLVGDWDGTGGDTLAVRRGAEYHVKNSITAGAADQVVVYGRPGDDVLAGDWDGDGRDSLAVRRGAEYHVKNAIAPGGADVRVVYGRAADEVYVGDWDGDGEDSLAVYRF